MASLLEAPILEAVRDLQRRMTTLEQGAYVSAPTGHTVSTDAETQKISMQTQKISMQTAVHSFKDDAVATRIESNEAATPFVTEAARATRTVCRRARRRRLEQSNRHRRDELLLCRLSKLASRQEVLCLDALVYPTSQNDAVWKSQVERDIPVHGVERDMSGVVARMFRDEI